MSTIDHEDYCPDKGDRRCDCDWEARVRADERQSMADVRDKVLGLTRLPLGGWDVVFLKDVLALFPEEESDGS